MKDRVRLVMMSEPVVVAAAFEELRSALSTDVLLEPVYVSSYAAVLSSVDEDRTLFAWASPLVGQDLIRARAAIPLAAVSRQGSSSYYSALVAAQSSRGGPHGRPERRIGWVSKLSAAGYVLPRFYLQSVGVDLTTAFAKECFLGSHAESARALLRGSVDLIATHSHFDAACNRFVLPAILADARLMATAGPIPGDAIMGGLANDEGLLERIRAAFVAMRVQPGALTQLMNVTRFEPVSNAHFDPLRWWSKRAHEASLRPLVARDAWATSPL